MTRSLAHLVVVVVETQHVPHLVRHELVVARAAGRAVILMLAIGQGAQAVVKQTIATMGSNLFVVISSFSTSSAGPAVSSSR